MQVQVHGETLQEALSRVSEQMGPEARIVSADKVRRGGVGGFFATERFEVTVDVPDEGEAAGEAAGAAASVPPAPAARSLADLLDAADADVFTPIEGVTVVPATVHAVPDQRLSTEGEAFAQVLAALTEAHGEPAADAEDTASHTVAAIDAAEPAGACPEPAAAPDTEATIAALRALRADAAQAAAQTATAPSPTRPEPLPRPAQVGPAPSAPAGAGEVLVIVGDGTTALGTAWDIARRQRLDATAVHLVAPGALGTGHPAARVHRSAAEAKTRRAAWGRRPHPTLVALDAPLTDPQWGAELLEPLEATAVWAVVSATTKTADLALWLGRLGRVDALCVVDAEASADPGSVRELELPIAMVDGRPA